MYSRFVSVFLCILLASGCSTVTPVEMTPEQVQKKISIGVGDTVKIATSNGEVYNFKVTAVTNQQILGDDIEIPIEEVVAIETKEFSAGKTAALAGGTVLLWAIIVAVALGGTLAL
jgi:capsular polysaccharide biosynthesis protein